MVLFSAKDIIKSLINVEDVNITCRTLMLI